MSKEFKEEFIKSALKRYNEIPIEYGFDRYLFIKDIANASSMNWRDMYVLLGLAVPEEVAS